MADVFISYSKNDVADARKLAALLEANGYSVWWDNHLEGGEQFRGKIASELASARAVIVIWTKSSVASDWVQSEAGRALADHKLVPVRSSEIEYSEIPPPFENRHTLKLSQLEQILVAVAAPLAKPAAPGQHWKVLRYEVLLWIAALTGAITLTNLVSGMVKLSNAATALLTNWSALLQRFWHAVLFFKVEVSAYDAELLTICLLLTTAVFSASLPHPTAAMRKSPKSLLLPLFLILLVMVAGTANITYNNINNVYKDTDIWIDEKFGNRPECATLLKAYSRRNSPWQIVIGIKPSPDRKSEIKQCIDSPETAEETRWDFDVVANVSVIAAYSEAVESYWIQFVVSRGQFGMIVALLAVLVTPLVVPFLLYWVLSLAFPLNLQVSALARRLWRTLILFGLVLLMNAIAVPLERALQATAAT